MLKIIIIITAVSFFIKFINSKTDYKQAKMLSEQFEDWLVNPNETNRPSNAVLEKLYEKRTGNNTHSVAVRKGNRALLITEQADLIGSFPSTHPQLLEQEFVVLRQLENFYLEKYKETFDVVYWINFLAFLPANTLNYIGLKNSYSLKKFFNIIYWILTLVWTIYNEEITKIIKALFSSLP